MRRSVVFAVAFLATLAVALVPLARDRSPPMRPRRAADAFAILAAACLAALAAACTGDAAPAATAPPAATTATTPTPGATPTATAPTAAPTATPTATPAPAAKRYNRLDATGEAATAGSWAILGADGGVLTTWEGLRSDAATLRLNQTDADGTSRAAEFGAVGIGDLIEWRKADDCWVRYRVTAAPTRPASGSSRQEFPVEWITYAATGAGCTGAVGAATALRADEEPAPFVSSVQSSAPVRHGPWLIQPRFWTGALDVQTPVPRPTGAPPRPAVIPQASSDTAVVRRHPLWRDPVLPTGWTLDFAVVRYEGIDGYWASYLTAEGGRGVDIFVTWPRVRPEYVLTRDFLETRVIDGHPALVSYSPETHGRTKVFIYNEESGVEYLVEGISHLLRRSPDAVIAIARSLLPAAGAP